MVNQLVKLVDVTPIAKLTFNQFMDTCVTEIDPSINTQMVATNARSQSELIDMWRKLKIDQKIGFDGERYRQCCGAYPQRKPFTYSGLDGMACCANSIFNQKFHYCCENGSLSSIGDVCWWTKNVKSEDAWKVCKNVNKTT